jgi:DNA polymerase sigma
VLKLLDLSRNLSFDLCVENYLGVMNTKLLETYAEIDKRVTELVLIIKIFGILLV